MNKKINNPPDDSEQLIDIIKTQHPKLSNRLQRVASYVVDNPNDMAIETIAVISKQADVQPSVLIRFAKQFGYSGFTEMQQVFKSHLRKNWPSYEERVHALRESPASRNQPRTREILNEFVSASKVSLEFLQDSITDEQLEQATNLLLNARTIYVLGLRRSFPVASYFAYAFSNLKQPACLLDGIGGMMLSERLHTGKKNDLLLAISFRSYSQETIDAVEIANEKNIPLIAITDATLSPLAQNADCSFIIKDAETRGFRGLSTALCLAQTLVVSLAAAISDEK